MYDVLMNLSLSRSSTDRNHVVAVHDDVVVVVLGFVLADIAVEIDHQYRTTIKHDLILRVKTEISTDWNSSYSSDEKRESKTMTIRLYNHC